MSSSNDSRLLAQPFPGRYEVDDRLVARRFTYLLGAFLLTSGIWGFVSPLAFGVLSSNAGRATIETLLGLIGLRLAFTRVTYEFLMLCGALLLAIGAAALMPGVSGFVLSLLAVSRPVGVVYLVAGACAVLLASTGKTARP